MTLQNKFFVELRIESARDFLSGGFFHCVVQNKATKPVASKKHLPAVHRFHDYKADTRRIQGGYKASSSFSAIKTTIWSVAELELLTALSCGATESRVRVHSGLDARRSMVIQLARIPLGTCQQAGPKQSAALSHSAAVVPRDGT